MTTTVKQAESVSIFEGRSLTVTRVLWYSTLVFSLIIFVISIAGYIRVVQESRISEVETVFAPVIQFALFFGMLSLSILAPVVSLALAVLLFMRTRSSWMAYLTSLYLIGAAVGLSSGPFTFAWGALYGFESGQTGGLARVSVLAMAWFGWLFPTGQFTPRWLRRLILPSLMLVLGWGLYIGPFGVDPASSPLKIPLDIVMGGLVLSILPVQIIRYRRIYNQVERQQTRLVLIGAVLQLVLALGGIAGFAVQSEEFQSVWILIGPNLWFMSQSAVPIALALAVLRYRLWAVDVIIRRTATYGLISLLLGGVYFGGVVLLQIVFERLTGQQSPLAVVASTLVIAALFNPLRHRVQNFIDRRFDRRKYDAQRTLDDFAASARDEVDMLKLEQSLLGVVNETMQPESVSLWLRDTHS